MPDISSLFEPLEKAIRLSFLPALLRRSVNDLERELLSLPARFGGLGVTNPTESCKAAHDNSLFVSEPLVALIVAQRSEFDPKDLRDEVSELRKQVDKDTELYHKEKLDAIMKKAPAELLASIKISLEKGASSWVTAAPSYDHGTILHKGEFVDALYPLRLVAA